VQSPEETLAKGSGSAGHKLAPGSPVSSLRPGRAVRQRYLVQLAPDVNPSMVPADPWRISATCTRWCEVFLPGAGWIGLDPTSGLLASEGHIPLSCTPEPGTAAPSPAQPTSAKPNCTMKCGSRAFSNPARHQAVLREQWAAIDAVGHTIDADLDHADVRVTMGGEPTFVSVDDPESAEWNFTALSEKSGYCRRIDQAAPGALRSGRVFALRSGKWFPAEPCPLGPRSILAQGRIPIWKNESLIADESKNYGSVRKKPVSCWLKSRTYWASTRNTFLSGYEDAFYYVEGAAFALERHAREIESEGQLERDRIARIFQRGLGEVVGYALPLKRSSTPP